MFGLGLGEILIIGLVVLLVVGPDQLPGFMRTIGRYYGQLRRQADDLRRAFTLEADRMDAEERYAKLQERRRQAEEARKRALEAAAAGGRVSQEPPKPLLGASDSLPAGGPADADPETPAIMRPSPPPAPTADELPPGVSAEEWDRLPAHVKDLLRGEPRRGNG